MQDTERRPEQRCGWGLLPADQAVKANVPIVAEKPCEAPVVAVEWREVGGLLHGRLAP